MPYPDAMTPEPRDRTHLVAEEKMAEDRLIGRRDLRLFKVVDDPGEVVEIMTRHLERLRRQGMIEEQADRDTP